MITPRLRPRLELTVDYSPAELAKRVSTRLGEQDAECRGRADPTQIELHVREVDARFWSPQLNVLVSPGEGGSALIGHFGPGPVVWTFFMACYGATLISGVFGTFVGVAQWMMDREPWALLSLPAALAVMAVIYVAAGIGQRLGHHQTDTLQEFLERAAAGS